MRVKKLWVCCSGVTLVFILASIVWYGVPGEQPKMAPNDWFYGQRAWPQGEINDLAYRQALAQTEKLQRKQRKNGQAWLPAGPINIGGRITAVAVDPNRFDVYYLGAATGGVFKTTNSGADWTPIFDEFASLSIGALALDPNDAQTLYVGTGEANGSGSATSYSGTGLFKTMDGGLTWQHLGLEESYHIGRIVIDPLDSQTLFVAAGGKLHGTNPERGVYRSNDGGASWERVLFVADNVACIDIVLNPSQPQMVYAAMWERERGPDFRDHGGVGCGIWRSIDGGDNWQEMTNGVPNNSPNVGRIGLAISASSPNVLYAIYADNTGFFEGIYKTTDGGLTWSQTNDGALSNLFSSFGWYFANIRVDPLNPNTVYALGLDVFKSTTGGNSWFDNSATMHVDQHDLFIHPLNASWLLAGNDGGLYLSQNAGGSYAHFENLPITQFYTCSLDFQNPERRYGGTQDNGTNRTTTGQLDDWSRILGGDGFYVLVDPTDNRYVYAESQYGGLTRSTNGGASFVNALNGVDSGDRRNWNSPLALDPNNPQTLYFGTNRLYRSTNRAVSWSAISPDLSDGPGNGNLVFGTLTTIAVAPTDSDVIYAGLDDGNVWVTENGGASWSRISGPLPNRYITRVAVSPDDAATAYVTLSGFRQDSYLSHIFQTSDAGQTWLDISANLPEFPLNDIIIDPDSTNQLFVAADVGVWVTRGFGWEPLGTGLPNAGVADLEFHNPTRTLLAGTYGRSMFQIDVQPGCFTDQEWGDALAGWPAPNTLLDLLFIQDTRCP